MDLGKTDTTDDNMDTTEDRTESTDGKTNTTDRKRTHRKELFHSIASFKLIKFIPSGK